ncbi:hypothetical protein [Flavobacterium sp.]|uniref:hypothetical protein n=1 Tax=Flavobacterium sp. TaxID=239 RepID=UPI002B4ADFDD|nr:hypothetical protein [Flavobacterium sp.]HLF52337.1 hypothetical protein [Flavobacterium sp.]
MQIESTRNTKVDATNLFQTALRQNFNPALYRKSQKPKWSRFKLKFNYRDGNESTHFSYDWNPDYSTGVKKYRDDEQMGFSKLILLIGKNRDNDTYNIATIYMTVSIKKDTSVQDYDIPVAYIQRGKDIKIEPRLKYTPENKVRLELFKTL